MRARAVGFHLRHLQRILACLTLTGILVVSLTAPLQTAPAPAQGPRITLLSFAANLPPPVDRIEIRQAVAYAVDRQALATVMPGAYPAVGINHPKLPGYNPQVKGYGYDPSQAITLVTRVGWNPESLLRIYIATSYRGTDWDRIREKILRNLYDVGIKAQFVQMSFDALIKLLSTGGGASYLTTWLSDRSDFGYPYFSLGIAQLRKYQDGVDQLIQQFEQTADPAAKQRIAQDLEQLMLDRALVVPLFFRD